LIKSVKVLAACCFLTMIAPCADASTLFVVDWSGAGNGNSAVAHALITIDETSLPNPGSYSDAGNLPAFIQDLTLTVSGASSGNGAFTLSDFQGAFWNTAGMTLDLGQQLVGQGGWGSTAGDFNLFNAAGSPSAPNGEELFLLAADGGTGDEMNLTSFIAAPEPGSLSFVLLGACLIGLAALRSRRKTA
jgi:PEP-CTERM motif